MIEKEKCQSKYRDVWGKVWTCEGDWGHGIGFAVKSYEITHWATLPADLMLSSGSNKFQWRSREALKD